MLGGYIIQIINFLWLTLLGLYLEQVLPKEFGKQQSVCFCVKMACDWCCSGKNRRNRVGVEPDSESDSP
jgi:hypothetical protein